MKRWLFNIFAAVSLLLFVATVTMGAWSFWKALEWRGDEIVLESGNGLVQVDVYGGGIAPYWWGEGALPKQMVGPPPLMWRGVRGRIWAGLGWREYEVVD